MPGDSRTIAEQHGNRGTTGHRGEWGSRGDHKEGNSEYPEAAMPQLLSVAPGDVGCCRGIFRGWT
jgi:hypothetical protein